jgi:trans-aconitate methyltransferase
MGRGEKNRFVQGDFLTFVPSQQFDVILMREAMYHVPHRAVAPLLKRLSQYLKSDGVLIVRMGLERKNGEPHPRLMAMVDIIEADYNVIEKQSYGRPGPTVIVFRPSSVRS